MKLYRFYKMCVFYMSVISYNSLYSCTNTMIFNIEDSDWLKIIFIVKVKGLSKDILHKSTIDKIYFVVLFELKIKKTIW